MANFWKIGCNWGPKNPFYDDLMISHKILIIGNYDVKIGDYAAIAKGFNIVAIAEVSASPYPATNRNDLKELFENKKIDFEDWNRIADAKIYQLNDEQKFTYHLQQGIREIHKEEIIKKIEALMKVFKGKMNMKEYTTMLRNNHNLILTGAPGTGKTYLAKQIAKEMGCSENEIGFVQFHPSYDYTDFVEGLRPIQDDNGNVGFERKDGVFKEFCSRALKGLYNKRSDNFDEVWNLLVSQIDNNDYIEIDLLRGKNKIRIELNEYGDGLANRTYEDNNYKKGEWIRGQSKFFSKEQCYNVYKGLNGTPSGGHDNYRKAIVNYMKKELGLLEYKEGEKIEGDATRPYVFIIDEINRGEISKIFGELFFAIDPGYRGAEKCSNLRTQYANLQKSQNTFDEVLKITDANNYGHFFVPENVYIIGTMNDIDRSVESMDFAFRRRFAFKEIKADENVGMLDGLQEKEDAIKRMKRLNDEISKIEGLSSAYHIGVSYFLKLKNYDGDFDKLWEYHLEGLLREYLRGMQDIEGNIKKLKDAYNGTTADNGQQPVQSEAE